MPQTAIARGFAEGNEEWPQNAGKKTAGCTYRNRKKFFQQTKKMSLPVCGATPKSPKAKKKGS